MQADSLPAEPPGNLTVPLFATFTLSLFYLFIYLFLVCLDLLLYSQIWLSALNYCHH